MNIKIDNNQVIFEGMTSISSIIKACDLNHNNARQILHVYLSKKSSVEKHAQIAFLRAKSNVYGFDISILPESEFNDITTGNTHGGIIAVCSDKKIPILSDNHSKINKNGIYYLIEGIEDPYNFGYTLRALYAAGADGVVLPFRNWMSAAGIVARSSAGCSELIDMYMDNSKNAVEIFKNLRYRIIVANIRNSVSIYNADLKAPVLFVIGGEKRGVTRSVLDMSDQNIKINYGSDFSGSLPTAEAAAIIAFEASRVNNKLI